MTTRRATEGKMSRQEFDAFVDAQAQRYLKMTRAQFVEAVQRGEKLPDHPAVAHLLLLTGAQGPSNGARRP